MCFYNLRKKSVAGFSLLELMVVVAIIGVLATFAVPRYNIFRARARQGEAKSNMGTIFTLQEAFKIEHEQYYNGNGGHWGGDNMDAGDAVGHDGAGGGENNTNKLGYRLANPEAARYRYFMHGANETVFLSVAYGGETATVAKRIFPGCNGANASTPKAGGSAAANKCLTGTGTTEFTSAASGDYFCLNHDRELENFRDIVEYCED